ncbi:hypothetical protein C5167_022736 [Papaver somniferum]|uniref:Ninja-family protein n=1 Tax=Papaver somniferum TaxID=3469 RepID=A0A4Y7JMM9_PAPSO|nr:ninja-family protein 6-like isoform X2 [Papaver somniferum]RZC60989.1 hypothetical protein C5167_022736 [Papaver somniferum]
MASSSLFFQTRSSVMGERNNENSADIDNEYPKDLLQRFMAGNHFPTEFAAKTEETEEDDEEIELNLSLGGCFGVNPSEKKRLMRSSSISVSGLSNLFKDEKEGNNSSSAASLIRTCSLPVVVATEEERRKRKELQSLRRLEAKRKRSEKQKNCTRVNNNKDSQQEKMQQQQQDNNKQKNGLFSSSSMAISFRGPNWGSNPSLGRNIDINGVPPPAPSPVSVSMNSQASSSSGGSDEIHGRPVPGLNSRSEMRSPMSSQSFKEHIEQKPVMPPAPTTPSEKPSSGTDVKMENTSYSPPNKVAETGSREMGMKMMEEMPCVSTKGYGPNGKRIEGFLYKYRKGEEVRIVCVCHGSFLTPAEFVKHAGGIDVTHPLRHITVSQTPSF